MAIVRGPADSQGSQERDYSPSTHPDGTDVIADARNAIANALGLLEANPDLKTARDVFAENLTLIAKLLEVRT